MSDAFVPDCPDDLGVSGQQVWCELLSQRRLGATHLALVHNCCRIVDRLDELAASLDGRLVVVDDKGVEVASPLLTEHRQQFLALRSVLKDLKLMELPEVESGEVSGFERFLQERGLL